MCFYGSGDKGEYHKFFRFEFFVNVLIYVILLLSSYKESSDLLSWSELARNPHKQLICAHPEGDAEPFLIQVWLRTELYLEPSRTSMMDLFCETFHRKADIPNV